MRKLAFGLGVMAWSLFGFSFSAYSQNKITWSTGYPKTSTTVSKSITCQGSFTLNTGWTPKSLTLQFWQSGARLETFTKIGFTFDEKTKTGTFGPVESQLGSADTLYNVIGILAIESGGTTQEIVTAPEAKKSK